MGSVENSLVRKDFWFLRQKYVYFKQLNTTIILTAMLLVLCLLNLVLASVESTKFTVCKSITSVEFDQNKGNKECSESTLFFEESSYVDIETNKQSTWKVLANSRNK